MKIAIISDIHGNLPALEAVIEDARQQGVDQYILLGDYVFDLHWPNEVIEKVKNLENSICVGGNKEIYIKELEDLDQSHWTIDQYSACYWNYRNIKFENRQYLYSLPEKLEAVFEGTPFFIAHKPEIILGDTIASTLSGISYAKLLGSNPDFDHSDYLQHTNNLVLSDCDLNYSANLNDGIYLFGHYHTQWHAKVGNRLYLNPGSCGLPVDNDSRAAYTILEHDRSEWIVNERRVAYDTCHLVASLRASSLYKAADIWCEINIIQIISAREKLSLFFNYMDQKRAGGVTPYPNWLWRDAGYEWLKENGIR